MKTLAGGALAAFIAMSSASAQTQIVSEDIMVKSPDPGIEIFVRNKRPANPQPSRTTSIRLEQPCTNCSPANRHSAPKRNPFCWSRSKKKRLFQFR